MTENLVLMIYGAKDGLIKQGLLEGDSPITDAGRVEYRALKRSGYSPDRSEIVRYLVQIDGVHAGDANTIATLLMAEFSK